MLNRFKACRISLAVTVALLLSASATSVQQAEPQRYLADIKSLASPEMEGRGAGTKGLTRAEHLIEKRYKELGLDPAGVNGYTQPFPVVTGARLKSDNHFSAQISESKRDLKINEDYVPFSFSTSGQAAGAVVFAGYGATADEFHYDDYDGLDAKDKIVVVLRYEPSGFAEKSGNHGLTQHSQLVTKAINARNHGAKALVVLNGKLGDGEEDLLTRFGSVSGPENVGIIVAQAKNSVAEYWFRAAGKTMKEVQAQINSTSKAASFAFPGTVRLSLHVDIETTRRAGKFRFAGTVADWADTSGSG
jgi:PA domain